MIVTRNKKDQWVIKLDGRVDRSAVQRTLDRLELLELTAGWKKVPTGRVRAIADEITAAYWARAAQRLARASRR